MNNDKSVEADQIAEGKAREAEYEPPVCFNDMVLNNPPVPYVFLDETWSDDDLFVIDNTGVVTFEEVAQDIFDECFDLLVSRQRRYGPTNIDQQGPWGVLSRIANDKLARIKRAFNGRVIHGEIELDPITDTDTDESYEDALKDLVNYGVILLLLHRGLWGKPLEDEVGQ